MDIQQLVNDVKTFFQSILQKEANVIGVRRRENGWIVQVETIEDSDYQRRRALDDVVGLYEVEVSGKLEILGYKRIGLRERDEIGQIDDKE
ncbi:gas vesicle protein GvpO [Desulfosporosinus sp. BICA1-9]|uniref:gas vesicle protein GvpO n=1 Tax=Desulfosporosinus sp. BICA1-9 TaxID=1531958 RepID=UPI00054B6A7D|nr:gas vesicle protein GvpO [Desulfosporosinus sp. BICA1-9]KJS90312.1 MAG: hypothetical protein JL57_02445 [Desulfosporosinus sp. BICA1-9]HBW38549.1 hypothetical protein [Desulfosporosinus sp.]